MWMSELSQRSGVPVATVKFYLRERLLPPGRATGATRAVYDDGHVHRLRLIRALVDVAGMSLERVRQVLAAVDDKGASLHDVLTAAHEELSPIPAEEPSADSRRMVGDLIRRRRWRTTPEGRHATALAGALDAMTAAGQPVSADRLDTYAEAAGLVASVEVRSLGKDNREDAATYAVIGTVLAEPVFLGLRRMAHEDRSVRRFSRTR